MPARTDRPLTWRIRDAAERLAAELRAEGRHAGIGLIAHERRSGERVVIIDLDAAIDPSTGAVKEWATVILHQFPTYAEVSPGGRGLHIVLRIAAVDVSEVEALLRQGSKIRAGRKWFRKGAEGDKAEGVEFFWNGFATYTGDRLLQQPRDVRLVGADRVRWLFDFAEAFKVSGRDSLSDIPISPASTAPVLTPTTSPMAEPPTTRTGLPEPAACAGMSEGGAKELAHAAQQQPGRRMAWDGTYIAGLAARLDDAEFSVLAAYATIGRTTRRGQAEGGVSIERLRELTGRTPGSRSSSQTITAAKARLVGTTAIFQEIEPMIPPTLGRGGSVARFVFKAWSPQGQDKGRVPLVVLAADLWEDLLRSGAVRRRSLRIIVRVLSELSMAGHDPSEVFVPQTCGLASTLAVEPGNVARALDEAVSVGLLEVIEARRHGRPASYRLSRRGAARWPTPRILAV